MATTDLDTLIDVFLRGCDKRYVETLNFVENYTDEGAVWELDSIVSTQPISAEAFDRLQESWFVTTDSTGESMRVLTQRFETAVLDSDRVEVFLNQRK